jgi:NitT/TauT family transport system substrate-binding protein
MEAPKDKNMQFVQLFTLLISFSFLLLCCSPDKSCEGYCSKLKKATNGNTIVRLQQQWFANSGFAGELMAQNETASKYGLRIEVLPGSDQVDTKQIVKLGEAEFGVAGAEQIMQANEIGAGLVIVGVINYRSLACFISRKSKNIIKPKDMEGHKIGTMEGSPVDLIYQALKKKEGLAIDKNDEIPTGWVLTGFEKDLYDVYPAFINDEPIKLQLEGIEVNSIIPSNYGINFIGTVYFCKKELVECCPEIVQSFVNSIIEGWAYTIKDPKRAIDYLKKYDPNIDEVKELESLQRGMDYYKGEEDRILYTKRSTWADMAALLEDIGKLKSFNYDSSVQNKFISWYYSRVKEE